MARERAIDVAWDEVEVFGKKCLFTCMRVDRNSIPKGLYFYEVRHDDDDWGVPIEVALGVLVNHYGTLVSKEPLPLEKSTITDNAYASIDYDEDFNHIRAMVDIEEWAL